MNKRIKVMFFVICFVIIQSLIIFGLFKNKNGEYVGNVAGVTAIFIVFTFFEFKYKLYMSSYSKIIIIITIVSHSIFGDYLGLYKTSKYFDKALHFFGTYSFAYFIYSFLNMITKKHIVSKPREFIFVLCLGVSLGVLLEIGEFLSDVIFKPKSLGQSGLIDTNLDLICDFFGAVVASFHLILLNFKVGDH